jgi:hypothetical protein
MKRRDVIIKIRRVLLASVAGVAALVLGGVISAAPASAAPASSQAAISTQTIEVPLNGPSSSGLHPDAGGQVQLTFCIMTMNGAAAAGNNVIVSGSLVCQIPTFIVSGNMIFANNTHPYAASNTSGKSNGAGRYSTTKHIKGGTPGYRSDSWCVNLTLAGGYFASGCLVIGGM